MTRSILYAIVITICVFCTTVIAQVPQLINYQGRLMDGEGNPVPDNTYLLKFKIYGSELGNDSLWSSGFRAVEVVDGLFNYIFGDSIPLPKNLFSEDTIRYLGIQVQTDPEIEPRKRLISVGYAFHALRSDTSQHALTVADNSVTSAKIQDGSINLGDIGQNGATDGQIVKWNETASVWEAVDDTGSCDDWTLVDNVLYTGGRYGIAREGNVLIGGGDSTHVNFGQACTTGVSGSDGNFITVSGGEGNRASHEGSAIGGGVNNSAYDPYSTVGGGVDNSTFGGWGSTISGGRDNTITDEYSFVGGGRYNSASNGFSTIGGGYYNTASGYISTISGGNENSTENEYTTIGGGRLNIAQGISSTISGGLENNAVGTYATVGGGYLNTADIDAGTVSGGLRNYAKGGAVVAGGERDTANGSLSVIGGGSSNRAEGIWSVAGGGNRNSVAGDYSVIPGGFADTISADADYSYLFGINSNLTEDSTFMVDMPHIRFGDETSGYEFPEEDGDAGQVMATDGNGQLGWTNPSGGGWNHVDVLLHTGLPPTTWTDLNLQSYVGTSRALVMMKVRAVEQNMGDIVFRTNGEVYEIGGSSERPGWGASATTLNAGHIAYILVETDENGIIEWKVTWGPDCHLHLIGYIN